MRLEFTDEENSFREEVRTFLRDKLTSDWNQIYVDLAR